jgi:hypothetical protein
MWFVFTEVLGSKIRFLGLEKETRGVGKKISTLFAT